MKFSQSAGTTLVPLLARIVLAAAFMTAGYNKIFTTAEYDAGQAGIIAEYGVNVTRDDHADEETASVDSTRTVKLASLFQDEPQGDQDQETELPRIERDATEGASGDAPEEPNADDGTPGATAEGEMDGSEAAVEPLAEGTYRARSLHWITLHCHNAGWPMARYMAWLAAVTELAENALLLVGLFSRFWALGLSIAMGAAFYLVSMKVLGVHTQNPFRFAHDVNDYNKVIAQLSLFVLALGVFLTGPGALSLDRLIFGRRRTTSAASAGSISSSNGPRSFMVDNPSPSADTGQPDSAQRPL